MAVGLEHFRDLRAIGQDTTSSAQLFGSYGPSAELALIRALRLEHGEAAVRALRAHGTVILDVGALAPQDAQRVVDLCCGAAVVLGARVRSLVSGLFLFAPASPLD